MTSLCADPEIKYHRKSAASDRREWRPRRSHSTIQVSESWFSVEEPQDDLDSLNYQDWVLFGSLRDEWKEDTWHLSSIRKTISHPAYLKIIGMGRDALPLIFRDMREQKGLWFWALEAITRVDMRPTSTSMDDLHEAWLGWAEENGF
jgi:hypothetical protein